MPREKCWMTWTLINKNPKAAINTYTNLVNDKFFQNFNLFILDDFGTGLAQQKATS